MRALSLSLSTHFSWTGHLSLSLCVSLFYLLSFFLKNYQPRSLLHQVLPSPADPNPFFTSWSTNQAPRPRSFLHRPIHKPSFGDPDPFFTGQSTNQASVTQILSSPANPRTKLRWPISFHHQPIHEPSSDDPYPFFTNRSTNQASATQILSSSADTRTKLQRPISFLHQSIHKPSSTTQILILSSPANPRTKLRWPISFLHRPIHEQSSTTQILSSPANPRTKLHDPNHFFTGQSTNQTPQAPIYFFVGLSVWVCLCVGVFLCWFFCVNVFVCIWGKEDKELRSLYTEKREKNWCERKLIK